jgi:cytochrome c biogenesis protein CcmG/thiol:disulfide interchange protein DsbE
MNARMLPFAGFVFVLALLGFGIWWSSSHDLREVPSPLIGKPAPAFSLPLLDDPAKSLGIKLVGFNYKDQAVDAKRWLAQFGNPYDVVIADLPGDVAIDFGVTGAPETFLVDADGIVRYKYISPITPAIIATELLPRIAQMKQGAR